MNDSCQKVLLVLTQFGIQTFTSSTLPIFFIKVSVSVIFFTWSKLFVSKHLKLWSLDRNWISDGSEVEKLILVQACFEVPTRPSRKLQLWILVPGSELTLSYYDRTLTLKVSGFIPYSGLTSSIKISSDNFFLSKLRSFCKIKCFMLNLSFCAALMENIAVRLRHLFWIRSNQNLVHYIKNNEYLDR